MGDPFTENLVLLRSGLAESEPEDDSVVESMGVWPRTSIVGGTYRALRRGPGINRSRSSSDQSASPSLSPKCLFIGLSCRGDSRTSAEGHVNFKACSVEFRKSSEWSARNRALKRQ